MTLAMWFGADAMDHSDPDDLARFHAGDRGVLEACYRDEFDAVRAAVGRVLADPDRDGVVHDVFYRLLASRELRERFRGGSLRAWLVTLARNQAIDHRRRLIREELTDSPELHVEPGEPAGFDRDARVLVDRFRSAILPAKWRAVFDARFLRQLSQRDAARELGIHRTTLVYQEMQIRRLLRRFVLGQERS
jgi:RNA polymerase sigma-70 factor, ECF subfamily